MPGSAPISDAVLAGFLLAFARVAGVFLFVPIPGVKSVPETARVCLVVAITLATYPAWPSIESGNLSGGTLLAWIAAEASAGLAVGLAVGFVCDGFLFCMQMAGLQAGYSFASTVDPTTQADSTVLLVLAHLTTGLMFFACGFDREVIHILLSTMGNVPPAGAAGREAAWNLMSFGSTVFTTGLRLAGPAVALLLMLEIALAVASRVNAQLQLLTVSFPLKMLTGLAALAMTAAAIPALFSMQQKHAVTAMLRVLVK